MEFSKATLLYYKYSSTVCLHSYLPFESVEFTIPAPSVSISISAAPSLSFILQGIKQAVI